MPTYQYTCTDCGDQVEALQKFTDDPLTMCAACGGRLRKVFSPVGIVFKGSGFYRTDSRNGSGSTAVKDKQPSEPASGTNGSADKPAEKKASEKKVGTSSGSSSSSSSSSEKVA